MGVRWHILEVYHASTYLETLMLGLGWSEQQRSEQRQAWLRGEVNLQAWLNQHIRNPALDEASQKALHFLQKQADLDHTNYPKFKREGIEVIGSGQIEGANKQVIGSRLKITGARWSEAGARAKAFARSQRFTLIPLSSFRAIRLTAFPSAARRIGFSGAHR